MSKQKSLVIVQNVPTQFDIPLYNQIVRDKEFDLKVIYTQEVIRDAETGCLPQWDHVKSHNYSHHFLTHKERKLSVLLDMVLSASPDHVVVSGYWPKLHRDLARGLHKRNISMGLRSDNTIEHTRLSGPRGWLKKRYLSRLLPLYNYWHPVGQQAAEYLRFVSGAAKPVELFPYNVDNEWFRTQAKAARTKRSAILQKMSLPKDSMTLLGIMKWSDREDPMTLVKAYKLLLRTYPKLNLILVGDGPLRKEVNQELKGIKGVHLPGYVPYSKLPELYAVSDLFIHPAPGEPWGVSIQESLACGVPVIASDRVGSAKEIIKQAETGVFFESQDPTSLGRAISHWLQITSDANPAELQNACFDSLASWNYQTTIEVFKRVLS